MFNFFLIFWFSDLYGFNFAIKKFYIICWVLLIFKGIKYFNSCSTFCEASRGAAARSVTVKLTGCGIDPHLRRWNIYLNLYFHFFVLVSRLSTALSTATQHAMPPEFGRKWGTECVNTKLPLPTLLCALYSVKLIK